MDYTYLSKIEAGLVLPPSEEKIRALAIALDRSVDDLETLRGWPTIRSYRRISSTRR